MDCDLTLLRKAEDGDLGARIYRWDGIWVSLGRFQQPSQSLVDGLNTRWVTRPTGGAAVLHGHDLTVSIAVPMRRSVRHSYQMVSGPLRHALSMAGAANTLGEYPYRVAPRRDASDCFAGVSENDIVEAKSGRKICGCALRRTASAVLLQASIPIGSPLRPPQEVIFGGVTVEPVQLDLVKFAEALAEALESGTFAPEPIGSEGV